MVEIKLNNVSYSYGTEKVLTDINIHVLDGDIISILGPSGVGKTTLFHLIAGILKIEEGEVLIDGEKGSKCPISYMFQKDLLLEHKTILGNITLPLLLRKVSRKESIDRSESLLKTFGLYQYRDKYPYELSGGMRQRVSFLRSYMFGGDLLLLDEAFNALDDLTKIGIYNWYLCIQKQLGLTTLIITHNIDEALTLSNRIYILNNRPGQIVAEMKLDFSEVEDKEVQKLDYKKTILRLLGV